jgi:hypothetical protein
MEKFGVTSWQVLYLYFSFYAAGKRLGPSCTLRITWGLYL